MVLCIYSGSAFCGGKRNSEQTSNNVKFDKKKERTSFIGVGDVALFFHAFNQILFYKS